MLAEILAVVPQTRSIAMITYRPEYRGPLRQLSGATRIVLAPLDDSQAATTHR